MLSHSIYSLLDRNYIKESIIGNDFLIIRSVTVKNRCDYVYKAMHYTISNFQNNYINVHFEIIKLINIDTITKVAVIFKYT